MKTIKYVTSMGALPTLELYELRRPAGAQSLWNWSLTGANSEPVSGGKGETVNGFKSAPIAWRNAGLTAILLGGNLPPNTPKPGADDALLDDEGTPQLRIRRRRL